MTQSDNSSDRLAELARENEALRERYEQALTEIDLLKRDVEVLHDIGIYNYRHPLENAVAYQDALASIKTEIKAYISEGRAIEASTRFTFDNSLAKGRKMTAELRSSCCAHKRRGRKLRPLRRRQPKAAEKRLTGAATSIRYASMMEMHINPTTTHCACVNELTADYK
jgi:hypothetical protein